jgi:selenophosphate synthase
VPGGTRGTHKFLADWVDWGTLPEARQLVLSDAQTSGGLLVCVAASDAAALARATGGTIIGTIEAGPPRVIVR